MLPLLFLRVHDINFKDDNDEKSGEKHSGNNHRL